MKKTTGRVAAVLAAAAVSITVVIGFTPSAMAQSNENLRRRVEVLEQQLQNMQAVAKELQSLKQALAKTEENAAKAAQKAAQEAAQKATRKVARQAAKAAKTAGEEKNAKITWQLGGFGTVNYLNTDASGKSDSFSASFNPIFLINYDNLLLFESELEVSTLSDGSTRTGLEFANLNLFVTDWLTLTVGKFLSPFGDFQQHLHPSWINKLPTRPAGFVEDGGNQPLSEMGAMARGAFPVGSTTVDYAFFVGNGPQLAPDTDGGVRYEASAGDDNDNKAFGGRIGFRPFPSLTLGVSGMMSKITGKPGTGGPVSDGDLDVEGVDAAFTRGNWNIRGEWIRSHLQSLLTAFGAAPTARIPETTWNSWYAQASYRLAGLSDNRYIANLEPVIRYSQIKTSGFEEFEAIDEERWSAGLDYWFAPSLVAKIAYENRNFDVKEDENVIRLQLGFGF